MRLIARSVSLIELKQVNSAQCEMKICHERVQSTGNRGAVSSALKDMLSRYAVDTSFARQGFDRWFELGKQTPALAH